MADLLRGPVAVSAEELDWDGLEVLRDLDGEPHLLTRVQLSGGHFPNRALEPFLPVGKVRSLCRGQRGRAAAARLLRPAPTGRRRARARLGHPRRARVPRRFTADAVHALDRGQLPPGTRLRAN